MSTEEGRSVVDCGSGKVVTCQSFSLSCVHSEGSWRLGINLHSLLPFYLNLQYCTFELLSCCEMAAAVPLCLCSH